MQRVKSTYDKKKAGEMACLFLGEYVRERRCNTSCFFSHPEKDMRRELVKLDAETAEHLLDLSYQTVDFEISPTFIESFQSSPTRCILV